MTNKPYIFNNDKMRRLIAQPGEQFAESAPLEAEIRKNLARLGYEIR